MGTKTETRTIDGMTFELSQLDGWTGLRMSARLGRLLGPAIAGVLTSAKKLESGETDIPPESIGRALALLFEQLTPSELESLTRDLLQGAVYEHPKGRVPLLEVYSEVMRGKLGTAMALVRWSIEFNGFFDLARGLLGKAAGGLGALSLSTSEPTSPKSGPPGG